MTRPTRTGLYNETLLRDQHGNTWMVRLRIRITAANTWGTDGCQLNGEVCGYTLRNLASDTEAEMECDLLEQKLRNGKLMIVFEDDEGWHQVTGYELTDRIEKRAA